MRFGTPWIRSPARRLCWRNGCGAALAGGKAVRLLDHAFAAGINHYDIGTSRYYRGAERHLAPFLKDKRDKILLVSKAPVYLRLGPEESLSVQEARYAADMWQVMMDESLKELDAEYVDAYYLMGVNNPEVVRSEEMYNAFLKAKKAGKVRFFGFSTHQNAQKVLEAAIETNWYDLAMIGITPAGWYDWDEKDIVEDSPPLTELQSLLERARQAGIGLIGMKAARFLSGFSTGGMGNPNAFNEFYDQKLLNSPLSSFQKTYAYVLQHGLDVVNADMQNFNHLEENIIAATKSQQYFA
jgi:aryl-alcohol dehydrogenase-like predicted oxidoreductase